MFSVKDEIDKLVPVDLEFGAQSVQQPDLAQLWNEVARNVARLGKQQLRSNQNVEHLSRTVESSVEKIQRLATEASERAEAYRRENVRLEEEAIRTATHLLEIVDTLDDLAVMAAQRSDVQWAGMIDRLSRKVLDVFARIGLTEVGAAHRLYNEEEHEVLDTVEATAEQARFAIVEVIRRGFRYNGRLLRRAQVITAK